MTYSKLLEIRKLIGNGQYRNDLDFRRLLNKDTKSPDHENTKHDPCEKIKENDDLEDISSNSSITSYLSLSSREGSPER